MSLDIERIQKSSRTVEKFLRKNPRKPSSDAIHDLRTSMRSLETAFETLGLKKKRRVKRLLRDLANVRKRAGKIRDMDVLTEDTLKLKHDEERECLVQLLEYLGAERVRHARKLRRHIERGNPDLRRDLKRNSKEMEKILRDSKEKSRKSTAAAEAAKTVQLSSELREPARLTRSNLHSYRLKVKELRNVLQLSNGNRNEKLLERLGEIKDAIGEWHDWEELIALAGQQIRHDGPCRLLKHFKSTSDTKFKRALSLTNEFRKRSA
jgi:CHAD domain-containing protein